MKGAMQVGNRSLKVIEKRDPKLFQMVVDKMICDIEIFLRGH